MNDITDNVGIYADTDWLENYTSNPPPEAQQRVNGDTPLGRVERLRERWERQERAKQIERYNALHERTEAEVEDADETLDLIPEKVASWVAAMEAGTLDPEQVMRNIAELAPVITAIQETYANAQRDAEEATAMIDTDPATDAKQRAERFPSLRRSGPYVTEAWLRGDPNAPDPLGGAS